MNINGWKTYAAALLAIVVGVLALAGVDMSNFGITPENAIQSIWAGLTAAFLRMGITKSGPTT